MGFHCSYAAFEPTDRETLLDRLGLIDTGESGDWIRGDLVLKVSAKGWLILVGDYDLFDAARLTRLAKLAGGVVGGQAEDNDCVDSLAAYDSAGQRLWSVAYGYDRTLAVTGDPPSSLERLRAPLEAKEKADPSVAYLFDAPLDLLAELSGWNLQDDDPEVGFVRLIPRKPADWESVAPPPTPYKVSKEEVQVAALYRAKLLVFPLATAVLLVGLAACVGGGLTYFATPLLIWLLSVMWDVNRRPNVAHLWIGWGVVSIMMLGSLAWAAASSSYPPSQRWEGGNVLAPVLLLIPMILAHRGLHGLDPRPVRPRLGRRDWTARLAVLPILFLVTTTWQDPSVTTSHPILWMAMFALVGLGAVIWSRRGVWAIRLVWIPVLAWAAPLIPALSVPDHRAWMLLLFAVPILISGGILIIAERAAKSAGA